MAETEEDILAEWDWPSIPADPVPSVPVSEWQMQQLTENSQKIADWCEREGKAIPMGIWENLHPGEEYPMEMYFWDIRNDPEEFQRAVESHREWEQESARRARTERVLRRRKARQLARRLQAIDAEIPESIWVYAYPEQEYPLEMWFWHLRHDPEAQQQAIARYRELFPENEEKGLEESSDEWTW